MSHAETIINAILEAGPLTRAELLEVTGIKDTVLDATLTSARKRGKVTRLVDSGRWNVTDEADEPDTDDEVPTAKLAAAAKQNITAPAKLETDIKPAAPVTREYSSAPAAPTACASMMQTPSPIAAPAPATADVCMPEKQTQVQTQTPSLPVATATVGDLVVTISGAKPVFALKMLAAALSAAVVSS